MYITTYVVSSGGRRLTLRNSRSVCDCFLCSVCRLFFDNTDLTKEDLSPPPGERMERHLARC